MHSLPSMTRCLKSATDLLGLICVFSRCHVLNYDLLRSHNVFRSISLSLINAPPGESEASLRHEEFEQLRIDDGTLPVRRQDHLRCPAFDVVFRSSQPTPQVPSLAHQHRQKASHKVRFTVGSRFWGDLCFILMPCCCLLTHEFDWFYRFLESLSPPVRVDEAKVQRWHPKFKLEEIPEVTVAKLPAPHSWYKWRSFSRLPSEITNRNSKKKWNFLHFSLQLWLHRLVLELDVILPLFTGNFATNFQ